MKTIYKYEIPIDDEFEIETHANSHPLSVQMQNGVPMIWLMVDTDSPLSKQTFYLVGTGNPITHDVSRMLFVGTIQMWPMVWHVFYKII